MGYKCFNGIEKKEKNKTMKNVKRVIATVLGGLLMCLPLLGCGNSDKKVIRLSEVTHSIFYAPLYVAINNGYFTDYGITVKLSNGNGATNVMTAIASKSADIGLMGPEATVYCHVEGQRDYPVIFGQLTQRDGSFLVAKNPEPDFKWSDTEGKHILAGRKGGMPAMTLEYVLNKNGVDTSTPNFDTTVQFDVMVGAFEGSNSCDYCTMFEPTASEFQAAGKGYIVASVGEASGYVPYTSFSAKKSYIDDNKDTVTDFLRAVVRGYNYLKDNDSMTVAKALAASFDGISLEAIASSVERYLSIDAWCHSPVFEEESFTLLQDIMENAGSLSGRADYAMAVDNTIARLVSEELL